MCGMKIESNGQVQLEPMPFERLSSQNIPIVRFICIIKINKEPKAKKFTVNSMKFSMNWWK